MMKNQENSIVQWTFHYNTGLCINNEPDGLQISGGKLHLGYVMLGCYAVWPMRNDRVVTLANFPQPGDN